MKTRGNFQSFFLAICIAPILLVCKSCNPKEVIIPRPCQIESLTMPEGYGRDTLYTLIFLDYTDRGIVGEPSRARLRNLLSDRLISRGDKIDIFLITSNTATRNAVPEYSFELTIAPRGEMIRYADSDSLTKSAIYACNRLVAIDSATNLLNNKFLSIDKMVDSMVYGNSDVAAFFFIANSMLKNISRSSDRKIVVISDLEQNCDGFFNLTGTRFSSAAGQAYGNPQKDFLSIIGQGVDPSFFNAVKLEHLPGDAPELKANNTVKNEVLKYWREVFTLFGMKIN